MYIMARPPDCRAYPQGTFPQDANGEFNATGLAERISMNNRKDVIATVTHGDRSAMSPMSGLIPPIIHTQQPDPTAECVANEFVTPFDDPAIPASQIDGMISRRDCKRCAHRVDCQFGLPTQTP